MQEALTHILWIDDQYDELQDVANQAKLAGFRLVPFRSLNAGIEELESNYSKYEAVLLDAKFYEYENDIALTEDTENAFAAQRRIDKLAAKKEFEIFVLSGQYQDSDIIDGSFTKAFKNFYRKGVNEDSDRLFADLQTAVNRQPSVQLRRKYASAFAVCSEAYISTDLEPILMDLLSDHEEGRLTVDHLNAMRKVLEKLGVAINSHNLVPSELKSINTISRVLRGDWSNNGRGTTSFRLQRNQFPLEVGKLLSSLIETTQVGSHPLYLDAHIRDMKTDYWLQASIFQLLAILEWFKPFIDSQPEIQYECRSS